MSKKKLFIFPCLYNNCLAQLYFYQGEKKENSVRKVKVKREIRDKEIINNFNEMKEINGF